jgi:vacuolar-type H+-ATPase subunit F/Vma7
MARAAVIGEATRTAGFSLVGATVLPAETQDEVRAAWLSLPADIAVVVLTPSAAAWLGEAPGSRPGALSVVMPP